MFRFANFVDLLRHQAWERNAQKAFTFLQDGETVLDSITYHQLDKQARAIAAKLQELKAKGERALLLYQPGLEFIAAFFGCLYAGVIAVPAYPPRQNRSIHRLQSIVADAQATIALTTQSLQGTISSQLNQAAANEIRCLATDSLSGDWAEAWRHPQIAARSLAFLQYTSGSTGTPKGVMVSHGNLLHNSSVIQRRMKDTSESQGFSWLPPYHDMGLIGGIIQPVYLGISMLLMSPVSFLQRPLRWLKAVSHYRVTTSGGPNFAYELCVSHVTSQQKDTLDLSSWELAFTGAEPVRAETLEKFTHAFARCGFRSEAFYPCYGMAEATLMIAGGNRPAPPVTKTVQGKALAQNQVVPASADEQGVFTLVGCGQTVPEQEIAVANPTTLRRCRPGEIGEIWVRGDSVAQGYWRKPTQTQEAFQAYLSNPDAGPFLRTGDLGFLDAGELFVTGRLKDLIIIRGRNHYPQDIELTVERSTSALRTGCIGAFAVEIDGEERLAITAEVKRSYLRKLNSEQVISTIRKAVVEQHELQPYAVVLLRTGSIPKTSSGKIARHACKAGLQEQSLDIVEEWRETGGPKNALALPLSLPRPAIASGSNQQRAIQAWLVAQIAQGLGVSLSDIDVHEPFVSYGLDSVQAVRLTAQLEDWLGRPLTPTLAYDYPSIASLSHHLAQLESQPAAVKPRTEAVTAIAIVGMGCRFPNASSPAEYWHLLCTAQDAVTKNRQGAQWGGFIAHVDQFEPQFFGISPREATRMDPQQRLLLEVSWEALENAGMTPRIMGSRTGVFVGISSSDYSRLQSPGTGVDAYIGTGNAASIAANRLSYFLDLRGPSLAVDTACSSSLVAVHLACQSLRNGECDQALVGGVNLILSADLTQAFAQAGMMAADGRCKTFDAEADGYVRGEGCGVVLLKPLEQAISDKDNVLAVLKGSAVNQDGRSNGLTAPNGPAQQAVVRQALASAGLRPQDLSYIEAHGTGTALGDPIEVNSLAQVLLSERPADATCFIGSVKTNIGHLEAAAGIAGLIKVVLALQHEQIPPHLHFHQLNPHIDLRSPLAIPTRLYPWSRSRARNAGVSSFGFGGTNAHVIVGDWETSFSEPQVLPERPLQVLTLSAKSPSALSALVQAYQAYLSSHPEIPLADICFSANTGRTSFEHRLAIITQSTQQLSEQLQACAAGKAVRGVFQEQAQSPKVAFLFTGQGSQSVDMGKQLYETQPTFRSALNRCADILEPLLDKPLLELLYATSAHLLDETAYTQPVLFAIEYALAQLWLSWGIVPNVVMGHSVGEYVAACIAGVFSLEDGLKLIAERGRLMQELPQQGAMVAIFAGEAEVLEAIAPFPEIAIAAYNGNHLVISGDTQAVQQAIASLPGGVKTKRLPVSHAFHSPLMDPILAPFEQATRRVTYALPQIDIVANTTGELAGADIATPQYWTNHVRQAVRFSSSIELLKKHNYQIFLEIGPKPILLGMGRYCVPNASALWLASLRPGREDWQQLLTSLAQLSVRGVSVDWFGFDQDYERRRVVLPTYPFQRQRYWIESLPPETLKAPDTYHVEWQLKPPTRSLQQRNARGTWLIFADRDGVGKTVAQELSEYGRCVVVYPGEAYAAQSSYWSIDPSCLAHFDRLLAESLAGEELSGIVYLWSLKTVEPLTGTALQQSQSLNCGSILHLIQALLKQSVSSRLWLVTRGAQSVEGSEVSLSAASLWGFSKVVALEHPELWGGIVDLAPQAEPDESHQLVTEMLSVNPEGQVAFRGDRYVARLVEAPVARPTPADVSAEKTYLIAGGLGALGLTVAQQLVHWGAKQLVLVGRSRPTNSALQTIQSLEASGARILSLQADVSLEQDVAGVLDKIEAVMPPLRGIIHAAGIIDDGLLQNQSWERLTAVLAPKVLGAWHLHAHTRHLPLDFFVLFSSVASLLGSAGQGNYAAANAFLDSIAHYRCHQGLPALSINWGPWQIGMAASTRLARGIDPIAAEPGLSALARLLTQTGQVGVFHADWNELSRQFPERSDWQSLVRDDSSSSPPPSQVFEKLLALPADQREEFLGVYLQTSLAQILQIPTVSTTDSLLDKGMDSLMVMEAIAELKRDLRLMLYPREFYERPKIAALAKYLAAEFAKTHGGEERPFNREALPPETLAAFKFRAKAVKARSQKKIPGIALILSSPRSGSTLLRVMLAGHKHLISPPELHLLPFNSMGERRQTLAASHLGEGLQRALMELKGIDAATSQRLVGRLSEEDTAIEQVYALLSELAGERLLIDKSPTYAFHRETLDRAEALFEHAKYIHLIRHPYAVIESFCRLRMDKLIGSETDAPHQLAESIWRQSHQNIGDFLATIDSQRHYLVRYEDLVANPTAVMQNLCQFLEVTFEASMLKPYEGHRMTEGVQQQSLSVGDPNFLTHSQIDARLGDAWKAIHLPQPLSPLTRRLAATFNYELPLADSPTQTGHEVFLDVRGLKLCLCTWGPETGPLVLCLHGILEQGAAWEAVAMPLAAQGYRVVAPDLRGHGRSDHGAAGGSYHLLDFLGDLDAIAAQLTEQPLILVGHSFGSVVAAMFASSRPQRVKKLVLVETILPTEEAEEEVAEQLATHLDYLASPPAHPILPDVAIAAQRLRLATPALSEATAMKLAHRLVEPCPGGVRWRWAAQLRTRAGIGFNGMSRSRYLSLLANIRAPITLIYGDNSNFNRTDDLQQQHSAMPHAQQIVLRGGHNLPLEAPTEIAEVIGQ